MNRWVEIEFDCLPLRSIGRLDIPIDASPKYRARCERIKAAIEKHGSHNSYFLYNAMCTYHVMNSVESGMIQFSFEGTALTNADDDRCISCDLEAELKMETCSWLTEPIVNWFKQTVAYSAQCEFDRYIEAGDLQKAKDRIERIKAASDEVGGYVGMYL